MKSHLRIAWMMAGIIAAAIPILIVSHYAFTHGGSNFSDDYWAYIQSLTLFMQGKLTFRILFTEALGPHLILFPFLIRVAAVAMGWWSPGIENTVSIVIGIFRVLCCGRLFLFPLQMQECALFCLPQPL